MRGSLALLIVAGAAYGAALPLARTAGSAEIAPLGYVFWQSAGALVLIWSLGPGRRPFPATERTHLFYYVLCALSGIVVPNLVLFEAVQHLPVALVSLIVITVPLFTLALCGLAGWERWTGARVLGIAAGFAGAVMVLVPGLAGPPHVNLSWTLLAMTAPLSLAACAIFAARARPEGVSARAGAVGMLSVAALILGPVAMLTGQFHVPSIPFGSGEIAILGQIVAAALAYILYFQLLRREGAVYFSQVGYVVVAAGVVWGVVLYGEHPRLHDVLAGALIVAGLFVVSRAGRAVSPPPRDQSTPPERPQPARSNAVQS